MTMLQLPMKNYETICWIYKLQANDKVPFSGVAFKTFVPYNLLYVPRAVRLCISVVGLQPTKTRTELDRVCVMLRGAAMESTSLQVFAYSVL